MSLARYSSARMYLSRQLALVDFSPGAVAEVDLVEGRSLQEVLRQVEQALPAKSSLEVHLSAAFCPAIEITYPTGIRRLAEKEIFARSTCATQMGVSVDELMVELDPFRSTVAAPLLRTDWTALNEWCQDKSLRLASVQPLWALASQSPAARGTDAIALQEPDSMTLLGSANKERPARALTLPLDSSDQAGALLHRMHQALALPIASIPGLRFGKRGQPAVAGPPRCWVGHWGLL